MINIVMTPAPTADQMLDALGNQIRRDIVMLLREKPQPVGTLAEQLPISRPAVSKHLRILQEAGLVTHQEKGVSNIFHLRPAAFRDLTLYLDMFWDEALERFKRAAEELSQDTL